VVQPAGRPFDQVSNPGFGSRFDEPEPAGGVVTWTTLDAGLVVL
jgi:hypothetical protein